MKASNLVKKLNSLIEENGDCDVVFSNIEDGVYPFLQEIYWADDVFFLTSDEQDKDDYEEPPWGFIQDNGLCGYCDWPKTEYLGKRRCNRCGSPWDSRLAVFVESYEKS
ncbi:hypothetical protein vB_PsyM_KIL3b_0026 [Pseudomonas phage vB_PsyM_KIL3b]|uniref:Uncharacterized protein n=3 Tax=Pseudomonas phage vB_PsyM_KIL1 TaxID=1777065 RepID=A0A142IDY3_9CAUD|nr:hypothetical protein vB_PsyM_KIL2_0027 [Pseudomonas phage vB_PsyM_KIL2]AMR57598.1 hypothetical protein vB_PsyM_KIL3_0026 [Pseudomonas phage vB_PsyM_KIL3]AMR58096.1 hypothetical protein vB_PsyM_KIL3b_0026 [Pseudomonas phage vB_PsyM_KIL3b]